MDFEPLVILEGIYALFTVAWSPKCIKPKGDLDSKMAAITMAKVNTYKPCDLVVAN
jgi:hypothetical protein